jgi:hypothetical protein
MKLRRELSQVKKERNFLKSEAGIFDAAHTFARDAK